ncbi:MAG TPA: ABC transporter permease [Chloroflexota bacterium]|nr:ABC transporter permease [Chloroflexota bacterium]
MTLATTLRTAIRALSANKLRALLTMLGIIIGVAAVISLMSVGRGAQAAVTDQIQGLGTNLLFVRPGSTQQGGIRAGQGSAQTLSLDDAQAIADQVDSVVGVAPEAGGFAQLVASGQNWSTRVTATTEDYPDVRNFHVADGDFFTRQQVDSRSPVVVLGSVVAQNLFGDLDPVGESVRISVGGRAGVSFRVIGVMETKGGTGLGNQDDQVFVPLTAYETRLTPTRTVRGSYQVSTINVQVADAKLMDEATQDIGALLRQRHRVTQDDFTIQSQADFLNTAAQVTGIMTILLGAIAGISLVVGGIGIMNIMLVSVTERTREIGIRKAIGARRRDILLQFLVEAAVVSIFGGLIGMGIGIGLAHLLSGVPLNGQKLTTLVTPDAVLLSVTVSAAVGLFFGIYPATRAARLRPIEALRYE